MNKTQVCMYGKHIHSRWILWLSSSAISRIRYLYSTLVDDHSLGLDCYVLESVISAGYNLLQCLCIITLGWMHTTTCLFWLFAFKASDQTVSCIVSWRSPKVLSHYIDRMNNVLTNSVTLQCSTCSFHFYRVLKFASIVLKLIKLTWNS